MGYRAKCFLTYAVVVLAANAVRYLRPSWTMWTYLVEVVVGLGLIVFVFGKVFRKASVETPAPPEPPARPPPRRRAPRPTREPQRPSIVIETFTVSKPSSAVRKTVKPKPKPEPVPKSKWDRLMSDDDDLV